MGRRLQLQTILQDLVGENRKVYFQPPNNFLLTYPCIVYTRFQAVTRYADNNPYLFKQRYTVTVVDQDPDSPINPKVAALQMCTFDRHFATDNLNHDVYTLYF